MKFPVFHPKWREGLQYWIVASSFVTNSPRHRFKKSKVKLLYQTLESVNSIQQKFTTGINLDNLFICWDSDSIYQLFILCGPPCPACMDGWVVRRWSDRLTHPPTHPPNSPLLTDNSWGWLIVLISDVQKMIYLLQWAEQLKLLSSHSSHISPRTCNLSRVSKLKSWWCRNPPVPHSPPKQRS